MTLDEIYAAVPDVECKGLCQQACGAIPISDVEAERIRAAGHEVPYVRAASNGIRCSALSEEGSCSVYEDRPLVCRLFGAVKTRLMRCQWGCVPKMTETESRALMQALVNLESP